MSYMDQPFLKNEERLQKPEKQTATMKKHELEFWDKGPFLEQIELVVLELIEATHKFPTYPTDPLHALAVLGEEYGELNKAVLQLTYEPHKTSHDEVRKEAIQTAAMAIRFLKSLSLYEYSQSKQHSQMIE